MPPAKTIARATTPGVYRLNQNVLTRIWMERLRQKQLLREGKIPFDCASPVVSHANKYVPLGEEFGEVGEAIQRFNQIGARSSQEHHEKYRANIEHLKDELTQLAAMSIAWLESLEAE